MDWRNLFTSFSGRIGRQQFWIGFAILFVVETFTFETVTRLGDARLSAIVDLLFVYPEFAVVLKRAHDRMLPLWPLALFFGGSALLDFLTVLGAAGTKEQPSPLFQGLLLPWGALGIALLINLGFLRGTPGANAHGPPAD